MSKRFPIAPAHPERNCWGCDHYCAAADMRCGNGSVRTPHPIELFGEDWLRDEAARDAEVAVVPPKTEEGQPLQSG